MKEISTNLKYIDRLGATASFVCAIHCALTPVAASILPLLGIAFLVNERIERVVLLASLALATASVCWGIRIHKQRRIIILFGAALSLACGGRFLSEGSLEIPLVVFGALLFVCVHLLNRHFCRMCSVCEADRTQGPVPDEECLKQPQRQIEQRAPRAKAAGSYWTCR